MDGQETSQPAEAGESAEDGAAQRVRSRYGTVERGGHDCLICSGTPNIQLRVERGLSVNDDTRKRYGKQTMFLDGVYAGGPLFDNESRQYSLDHHQGCVRAFTLATCEQAAVIVTKGLPLSEGEWSLYVNEPDLDAVLAAWILLNHGELKRNGNELLLAVMPFIRVEGAIDAHGLELSAITCGVSPEIYKRERERIDALLALERQLKERGAWTGVNVIDYTRKLLEELDRTLYPAGYLDRLVDVVEVARVPLEKRKAWAFLCRSHQGIYAVEAQLKQQHEKVGLVVLDQGDGRFTVRQTDSFLARSLADLYPVLNDRDDKASESDENCWGGSTDIGGSPRRTGSALDGEEILRIVQEVYGGGNWFKRMVTRLKT